MHKKTENRFKKVLLQAIYPESFITISPKVFEKSPVKSRAGKKKRIIRNNRITVGSSEGSGRP